MAVVGPAARTRTRQSLLRALLFPAVGMAVMDIRVVKVPMYEIGVHMGMRVRSTGRIVQPMFVLMMFIVDMAMFMN